MKSRLTGDMKLFENKVGNNMDPLQKCCGDIEWNDFIFE